MAFWNSTEKTKGVRKVKEEPCRITVAAEVPAEEVEKASQDALVQIQARARLPGFRPGKAPLHLIESKFADEAKQRVLDQAIRKMLPHAMDDLKIQPVASPVVHDIKFERGKPLAFQLTFEVAPKFEPKDYKKLQLAKPSAPAADAAVSERLKELRESNARLEKAEAEAAGRDHYVIVDYEGALEGKPLEGGKAENELIDMSAAQTAEGLTEGLLGAKRGETREIPVKLEGKLAQFTVTVKEIKTKVLPELTDELSKDMGFDTVQALTDRVRDLVTREHEQASDRAMREQIDDKLVAANPIPVPPSVVDSQLASIVERIKSQWLRSGRPWPEKEEPKLAGKLRPEAEKTVRLSYIIQAIAAKEKLEASDEEIGAERENTLSKASSDKDREALTGFFDQHREEIAAVLRERKVYKFLRDNAKLKDA